MVATPTCALRCRSWSPTSAAETAKRRRSSATIGRTTARLPLSECTSPSNTSHRSVPTTMVPPLRTGGGCRGSHLPARSDPGLLAQLEGFDHVLDLDVVERA